jgi:DNA polymerase-3 subunit beta
LDIQLDAKDLQRACTIVNQVKPKTSQLPLLQQLKITTEKDTAIFRYTNLEQVIFLRTKAKVNNDGDCLIPIKRTMQFAKYEKGKVNITTDKNRTILSSKISDKSDKNGIEIKLHIDKIDEQPQPSIEGIEFDLPTDFQRRITYALKCVATEESRPILTGVLFDFDGKELNMISCDGFWLVNIKTLINSLTQPFRIIIPGNALKLVSNFMNGKIRMGYNKERVWFKSNDLTIISQLIQGNYPVWQQLIPSNEPSWTINLSAPLLYQRLNQLNNDGMGIVRIYPKDNMLLLTNTVEDAKDIEEIEIFIPATMKGEGKIAFNKRYLIEASKIFSTMDIGITNPNQPLKVTGDLDGVAFVIMPMFVQW